MQCNIGFAELAVNMPDSLVEDTMPVLIDVLRDVPHIDFDRCMAWDGTLRYSNRKIRIYVYVHRLGTI